MHALSIRNRCELVQDQEGKGYIHLANVETHLPVGKRLFQNNLLLHGG